MSKTKRRLSLMLGLLVAVLFFSMAGIGHSTIKLSFDRPSYIPAAASATNDYDGAIITLERTSTGDTSVGATVSVTVTSTTDSNGITYTLEDQTVAGGTITAGQTSKISTFNTTSGADPRPIFDGNLTNNNSPTAAAHTTFLQFISSGLGVNGDAVVGTNGKLLVAAGDTITAKFTDLNGVTYTATATVAYHSGLVTISPSTIPAINGQSFGVRVADMDKNLNPSTAETFNVTVTSTKGDSETLLLTETGVNTGVFQNTLNLDTAGAVAADGDLEVAAGNTVTASYADAFDVNGATATQTGTATVKATNTGTISLNKSSAQVNDSVEVTVTDQDLNVNPTIADTIAIARTAVPGAGTFDGSVVVIVKNLAGAVIGTPTTPGATATGLKLTETGANTGIFKGTFTFNNAEAFVDAGTAELIDPSTDKLPAQRGTNNYTFTYYDAAGLGGSLTEKPSATLSLNANSGTIAISPLKPGPTSKITITVTDNDINANSLAIETTTDNNDTTNDSANAVAYGGGSIEVVVERSRLTDPVTDGPGTVAGEALNTVCSSVNNYVTVLLTETGANTGIFTGTVQLAALTTGGATANATNTLAVNEGDTLTAYYIDKPGGQAATDDKVKKATTTVASVGTATIALDKTSYAIGDTATITINDADRNADPTLADTITSGSNQFQVKSSTTALTSLTLTETGVNTGVFTGKITFSYGGAGVPTGNLAKITSVPGDTITANYTDPLKPTSQATTISATATIAQNAGTISLDRASYPTFYNGAASPATDLVKMVITVTDPDLNLNPTVAENLSGTNNVRITSTTSYTGAGSLVAQGNFVETGPNTGIFTNAAAPVTMEDVEYQVGGTLNVTGVGQANGVANLQLLHNETLTVIYVDANPAGGAPVQVPLLTNDAVIVLDNTSYPVGANLVITLNEPESNKDSATAETVVAKLVSSTNSTGITVNLDETGINTGIFKSGSIKVGTSTSTPTNNENINAKEGDTITASYKESTPATLSIAAVNTGVTRTASASISAAITVAAIAAPSSENLSATAGSTLTITVTAVGSDGKPFTGQQITAASSDTTKATVTGSVTTGADGTAVFTVTRVASGSVTITFTGGSKTATTSVTAPVGTVTADPATLSLTVGQASPVTVTVKDANGVAIAGTTVTGSSSSSSVAAIAGEPTGGVTDATGQAVFVIAGAGEGSATITFSDGSQSATTAVTVVTTTTTGTETSTSTTTTTTGTETSTSTTTSTTTTTTIPSVVVGKVKATPVSIQLSKAAASKTVKVKVTDKSGKGIANVDVTATISKSLNNKVELTSPAKTNTSGVATFQVKKAGTKKGSGTIIFKAGTKKASVRVVVK